MQMLCHEFPHHGNMQRPKKPHCILVNMIFHCKSTWMLPQRYHCRPLLGFRRQFAAQIMQTVCRKLIKKKLTSLYYPVEIGWLRYLTGL